MINRLGRRNFLRTLGAAVALPIAARSLLGESLTASPGARHRILTCNILLDLAEQKGTPYDWSAGRREVCMKVIKSRNPDVVCLQEVGPGQRDDFAKAFPNFTLFGYVDPYTDKHPRRFQAIKNVILYSTSRYELTSAGQYWLSETPIIAGSKLGEEKLPRHVTWVRLKDRASNKEFRLLNTHWALTQPVRLKEAQIIATETSAPYSADFPQLLAGDFNSESTSPEQKILAEAGWKDTYEVRQAGEATAPPRKIDFIFSRGTVTPLASEMFRDHEGEVYASDHPFVMSEVTL